MRALQEMKDIDFHFFGDILQFIIMKLFPNQFCNVFVVIAKKYIINDKNRNNSKVRLYY